MVVCWQVFPADQLRSSPQDRRLRTKDITWAHLTSLGSDNAGTESTGGELEQRSQIGFCGLFMVQVSKHLKLFIGLSHLLLFIIIGRLKEKSRDWLQLLHFIAIIFINSLFLLKFSIYVTTKTQPGRPRISIDINEGKKCHSYSGLYSQCVVYRIKFMSPRYQFSRLSSLCVQMTNIILP